MITDTRGAIPRFSRFFCDTAISGGPGLRFACAWAQARWQESLQVFSVRPRRRRFIVDNAREASMCLFSAPLFHQHAAGLLEDPGLFAVEARDKAVGGRAVARAHHLEEQFVLRFAVEPRWIERARGLAHELLGHAMKMAELARHQQKIPVLECRQTLGEAAALFECAPPHHELAWHDIPRPLEQLLHRRRFGAFGLSIQSPGP